MLRNLHVGKVQNKGFHAWANKVKYNRRNLVETMMGRFKTILGANVAARKPAAQINELAIKCNILNKFADFGTLVSVKVC